MSENANQTTPRSGSENSGNSGHNEQGGRRNSPSGNRNNRRRRPSQPFGADQSVNSSHREPIQFGPSGSAVQNGQQPGRPQNQGARPDPYQQKRNDNRPPRPNQNPSANQAGTGTVSVHHHAGPNQPNPNNRQNTNRPAERSDANSGRQGSNTRPEKADNQVNTRKQNVQVTAANNERPREARSWGKHIRSEETYEDVRKENERLEKEIWLEIASIHTFKLD